MAKVSNKDWGNISESDYSLEQWHRACLIHLHDGAPTSKEECKLPVKNPDGSLNRNGVHAAAGALAGARGGVDAPSTKKEAAARMLVRMYGEIGDPPPDSIMSMAHMRINGAIRRMAGQ